MSTIAGIFAGFFLALFLINDDCETTGKFRAINTYHCQKVER